MGDHRFFKHPELPFAECRYSKDSGQHYKPHIHKTFCIGAGEQGQVLYQIAEKTVTLRPGSLALINPEVLHSCNPAENHNRSYYMLFLDTGWCLQLQQSLWQVDTFCPVDTFMLEDHSRHEQYISTVTSLMARGYLLEKEQHLASTLEANPYTLLGQFKATTGIPPHAYRLNCRIELAKTLLRKGHELSQVALACGFFDQSHFHRHFKAITTVTPKAYQVNFIQ